MTTQSVITTDPEILSGTPVFAGTRVPASALFDRLEEGDTVDEFLDDYPTVSREQAQAVIRLFKSMVLDPTKEAVLTP